MKKLIVSSNALVFAALLVALLLFSVVLWEFIVLSVVVIVSGINLLLSMIQRITASKALIHLLFMAIGIGLILVPFAWVIPTALSIGAIAVGVGFILEHLFTLIFKIPHRKPKNKKEGK